MTIDERIASELRRQAPQVDEQMAWDRIESAAPLRRRGRAIRLLAMSAAALGFLVLGFILVPTLSSGPDPASDPRSAFLDTWVTTDLDGSTPTMVIQVSGGEDVEMLVRDAFASVCSGAASTMTGTGRLVGTTELVIPTPVLTCDDGSEPEALGGPPLEQQQLQNLTFVHDPRAETLTDNFGSVWSRVGAERPRPEPSAWADMWPQSSLEEAREAQELADAGDLNVTWQLEPALEENLDTADYLGDPEIFARFLEEELGWEEFSRVLGAEYGDGTIAVTYLRCAPGQNNSIYPDDPRVGGCAPTIDEFRYETVTITVAQPAREGPSGIWVVRSSEMVELIEQVVPLADAEATAILEAFLQARIDGEGAEQYTGGGDRRVQLLYATSTGIPYGRFEFESIDDPDWPSGSRRFEVRLFAEDGQTGVEQSFTLERDGAGHWGLEAGSETLENGQALPILYGILGGEVTFLADHPWDGGLFGPSFEINGEPADASLFHAEGYMRVLADPLPVKGCQEGPAPADAPALAQSILSNDDFEATTPVATTIGGAPALRMDLVMTAGPLCSELPRSYLTSAWFDAGDRIRLYLVDLPDGSSADILAVAIGAPESHFETVVEQAAPILDSFEFHTG
jgi:hypothetical protein